MGTVVRGGLSGILASYRKLSSEEQAIAVLERQKIEIVTSEEVTIAEAHWLASHIGRNGRLTPNEEALLTFLNANSANIAPELNQLLDRVRAAA